MRQAARFLAAVGAASLMLLLGTSSECQAQQRADELFWECTGQKGATEAENSVWLIACAAYVGGAYDMMGLLASNSAQPLFCPPDDGISGDEAVRIFVRWIQQHPEDMHQSARVIVLVALTNAFPCRDKSGKRVPFDPRKYGLVPTGPPDRGSDSPSGHRGSTHRAEPRHQ